MGGKKSSYTCKAVTNLLIITTIFSKSMLAATVENSDVSPSFHQIKKNDKILLQIAVLKVQKTVSVWTAVFVEA